MSNYLLDTNAYFMFFQRVKPPAYQNLISAFDSESIIQFKISEVTSMEIHSVLGKYRRGTTKQRQTCTRKVDNGNVCANVWVTERQARMKARVFKDLQKMISDVEHKRGNIQAEVLPVDQRVLAEARNMLSQYADTFSFGSHDAMVAATAYVANKHDNKNLVLVTSDRGLIAALNEVKLSYFDPTRNEHKLYD